DTEEPQGFLLRHRFKIPKEEDSDIVLFHAATRAACATCRAIHSYVTASPSSRLTCGSQPSTSRHNDRSAFRPRTPCGRVRSCRLWIVFPAMLATISTSSL